MPSSTTVAMPGGGRGGDGDDGDDERQGEGNHCWSLGDVPGFEGRGVDSLFHILWSLRTAWWLWVLAVDEDGNDPMSKTRL